MRRDDFTMGLDFGHEQVIDNFAGGGGASTALRIALGREPDIAINHDGEALCMHAANHPTTRHYKEDVFLVHPGFITQQQPIGVSPPPAIALIRANSTHEQILARVA